MQLVLLLATAATTVSAALKEPPSLGALSVVAAGVGTLVGSETKGWASRRRQTEGGKK
ncbi:MAG TPA: hypothetical protein VHF06_20580 [Pseudonocardiaceae bacterium]|nr:hypothetical protein [Pseudonocardiaceae bacterium]